MLGRFLAADPAGQFHSPYVYAGNNPIRFVDPTGEFIVEAMVVGALLAGASYSVTTLATGSKFTGKGLLTSMAFGAVSGAVSGGSHTPASRWAEKLLLRVWRFERSRME